MHFAKQVTLAVLVFAVAIGFPLGIPRAAAAGNPPASPEAQAAAKEHFARGETFFGEQRYAEAAEQYKAAYKAWPLDGFLFNIAQCERNLGHTDSAIDYFERYLKSPKAAQHRTAVEKLLAELREKQAAEAAAAAPAPTPVSPEPSTPVPSVTTDSDSPPLGAAPAPAPASDKPLYKKPWFWAVIGGGVVVVGGAIAIGVVTSNRLPSGSLGTLDWR